MSERIDFSNLSLAHIQEDPSILYRIGDGVLPKMGEAFGFELDTRPNADNMGSFVGEIGPKSTMRDNEAQVEARLADAVPTAKKLVVMSGIMKPVNGGLWKPEQNTPDDAALVLMCGVPRWNARGVELAINAPQTDVYIAAGSRKMKSANELSDKGVQSFITENDTTPKEYEYFERNFKEKLESAGKNVTILRSEKTSSWDLLPDLFARHPELLERHLAATRVANGARIMALQLRLAARTINPNFDNQDSPQMSALSDKIRLAGTKRNAANPAQFQSPVTAIRQIPVLAKEALSQTF